MEEDQHSRVGCAWRARGRDEAAETDENTSAGTVLDDVEFLEAGWGKFINASTDCTACWPGRTGSESATIVRRVTGLDGVEAWIRLHANYSS